jgi:hypothetical protein
MKRALIGFAVTIALTCGGAVPSAQAQLVFGLTTADRLVTFDASTPGTTTLVGTITGLVGGDSVVGMDFRVQDGFLYAVGSGSNLYTIDTSTAAATLIGNFGTVLAGAAFGVDFNPTNGLLRIVSTAGQNLSVNVTIPLATPQTPLNGATTSVTGAAYTNNFNGAGTTTLYDISSAADRLYIQSPPGSGTTILVGALGVNTNNNVGFDIVTPGGSGGPNLAFASLNVPAVSTQTGLYSIDLGTGLATFIGGIGPAPGPGSFVIKDIALTAVPEPSTVAFTTLTALGFGAVFYRRRRRAAQKATVEAA